MEVDSTTSPPSDAVENTDISALVELLFEYTPRDLKGLISPTGARLKWKSSLLRKPLHHLTILYLYLSLAPNIIDLPLDKNGSGLRQKADLVKLCLFLPRHILACLLKEDERFWIPYLVKAQKLLLHLTKMATKRGGTLAQSTFSNVPKMIDLCILATVRIFLLTHPFCSLRLFVA